MSESWDGRQRLVAGRFLLLRELGRGGMGRVWLAADETLGRRVAVKELRAPGGVANTEAHQARALREARSAAGITHPHAVTLHEVLTLPGDDAVYLIMEYVDGPTLGDLIVRHGPLPAPDVARYGLQLLGVLEAAHALGIVHRDVKPDNILIAAGDQAKLADFGIAYTVGDTRLTDAGVLGTRAYLAPELLDEQPVTSAADLWSLGATLYHAAEGHGPFDRADRGPTLRAVVADDIPVPRCAPQLAAAIAGLLRRDPGERATIEQTRERLRQVPGQSARLPPLGPDFARSRPWSGAEDAMSPGAAGAASAARDPQWNPHADTDVNRGPSWTIPPAQPERPQQRRPTVRLPGRRLAVILVAVVALAAVGTAGGLLAAHARQGHPGAVGTTSSAPVRASGTSAGPAPRTSPPGNGAGTSGSSGPTGSPAPGGGNAGGSTANGALALSKTIPGPAGVSQDRIAFSPDGALLATWGENDGRDALLWNPATGTYTSLPFGTGADDVVFSSDRQTVAVAEAYGGVGLYSLATHSTLTPNIGGTRLATAVAFSPQPGSSTLAVGDASGVRLYDTAARQWDATQPAEPASYGGPWTIAFSPDGSTLAAIDHGTGNVYVWGVSTGDLIGTIAASPPYGVATSISYSPDHAILAIGYPGTDGTYNGVRFWGVSQRTVLGNMPTPGVGATNALAFVRAVTPPEEHDYVAAGGNGKVFLWEWPAGRSWGAVVNPGAVPLLAVAVNSGGTAIATLDANDRIALWSIR